MKVGRFLPWLHCSALILALAGCEPPKTPLPTGGLPDGAVDFDFRSQWGANDRVYDLAVQQDGKILLCGKFTQVDGEGRRRIARLNPDGSLDSSFHPGRGANDRVFAIAVQGDGKILMGGLFTRLGGARRSGIARLNADGSLDTTFNPVTHKKGHTMALAALPDGKVLMGGLFTHVNGVERKYIARLNADGSLDPVFVSPFEGYRGAHCFALQPDGKVLVGGNFERAGGMERFNLARLNADGSVDPTFDTGKGPSSQVEALALQPDGKVLVGGWFACINDIERSGIARLNADGSVDLSFNPGAGADDWVLALDLQKDGKVLVGGTFTHMDSRGCGYVARLNMDGSLDSTFNPGRGADDYVLALALHPEGNGVVLGGRFTHIDGDWSRHITRLSISAGAP